MRLRQSPIAVLLLVPAGVLAGHTLGYAGAGHVHGGSAGIAAHSHGYLASASAVATLFAVLALVGAAGGVAAVRTVSFRHLLALQWGALLVQEGVEHALAGEPVVTLLTSLALWLSLAGQLAAAAGAALLVRSAGVVGSRLVALLTRTRPVALRCRGLARWNGAALPTSRAAWSLVARGPPTLSV